MSTVFVGNISHGAPGEAILSLFNGIDGTFNNRESNVVAAVSFVYNRESRQFAGQAYFLYTTVELAEFTVQKLGNREFYGRPLYVVISNRRLDVQKSRHGNVVGASRAGEAIWDCVRPQTRNPRRE